MADMTASELADSFEGLLPALERNLSMAVRLAAEEAAAEARKTSKFKDRSHVLRMSIGPDGPYGTFVGDDLHAFVSAGAAYAEYVEKGTRPHVIKPRDKRALRWPGEGGFMFAKVVHHPGTQATNFLADAVEGMQARLEQSIVPDAIELSFLQVGFSG